MKSGIKDRWIKALESGKYKKGKSRLRVVADGEDRFCCLGVLCELAIEDGVELSLRTTTWEGDYGFDLSYLYDRNLGSLPDAVVEWAGMSDNYGQFFRSGRTSLVNINDSSATFGPVIKAIEEYF